MYAIFLMLPPITHWQRDPFSGNNRSAGRVILQDIPLPVNCMPFLCFQLYQGKPYLLRETRYQGREALYITPLLQQGLGHFMLSKLHLSILLSSGKKTVASCRFLSIAVVSESVFGHILINQVYVSGQF